MFDRAVEQRRGVVITEAAGHRAQRRSNIEVTSTMLVPVVNGGRVEAVVVCERQARTPFDADHLDAAMSAALALAGLLGVEDGRHTRRPGLRREAAEA